VALGESVPNLLWVLGVWYGIDVIMFFVSHFNTMSLLVKRGGEHAALTHFNSGFLDRDPRRSAPCESGPSVELSSGA